MRKGILEVDIVRMRKGILEVDIVRMRKGILEVDIVRMRKGKLGDIVKNKKREIREGREERGK